MSSYNVIIEHESFYN